MCSSKKRKPPIDPRQILQFRNAFNSPKILRIVAVEIRKNALFLVLYILQSTFNTQILHFYFSK